MNLSAGGIAGRLLDSKRPLLKHTQFPSTHQAHARNGRVEATQWVGLLFVTVALVATGQILQSTQPPGGHPVKPGALPTSKPQSPVGKSVSAADELARRLIDMGWTEQAAKAVTRQFVTSRYLDLVKESGSEKFDRLANIYGRLGRHPDIQPALVGKPELAGVLAGALEHVPDGARVILDSLPKVQTDCDAVYSLYAMVTSPEERLRLARLIHREGDLAVRLCREGGFVALGALEWLDVIDPTQPSDGIQPSDEMYLDWVRAALESALDDPDEDAFDRTTTLLQIHAQAVRQRLKTDEKFLQEFQNRHWPHFRKLLSDTRNDEEAWGTTIADPRVWRLYAEHGDTGRQLFETRGLVAVDLLCCDDYRDCRTAVLAALENPNENVLDALSDQELRDDPQFVSLLKRPLPEGTRAKALVTLNQNRVEASRQLQKWHELSETALVEELGPPPDGAVTWLPGYNAYYLVRKVSQGRDVSSLDVAFAAVDAVETALILKGAGAAVRAVGKNAAARLAKTGMKKAAETVSKAGTRQLYPWTLREGHKAARQAFNTLSKHARIDITDLVRKAFQKSNLGRKSFKRLTDLEARIFMRNDRRVIIDLAKVVGSDHVVGRALRVAAVNAGLDLPLSTETAPEIARPLVQTTTDRVQAADKEWQSWKEHLAIWWTMSNTNELDAITARKTKSPGATHKSERGVRSTRETHSKDQP